MEGARHETADQMGDAMALPVKLKRPGQPSLWTLEAIRNDMKALLKQLSHEDSAAERKARTPLAALIGSLTSGQVDRWEVTLEVRNFGLQLPRFKFQVTYALNRACQQCTVKAK